MSASIRRTIAAFAAAVLALSAAAGAAAAGTTAGDGTALFAQRCALCHQPDGSGAPGLAPPLRMTLNADLQTADGRQYLSQILLSGLAGPIQSSGQSWNGLMPSFAALTDEQLLSVLGYVLKSFNGAKPADLAWLTGALLADARKRAPSAMDTRRLRPPLKPG